MLISPSLSIKHGKIEDLLISLIFLSLFFFFGLNNPFMCVFFFLVAVKHQETHNSVCFLKCDCSLSSKHLRIASFSV